MPLLWMISRPAGGENVRYATAFEVAFYSYMLCRCVLCVPAQRVRRGTGLCCRDSRVFSIPAPFSVCEVCPCDWSVLSRVLSTPAPFSVCEVRPCGWSVPDSQYRAVAAHRAASSDVFMETGRLVICIGRPRSPVGTFSIKTRDQFDVVARCVTVTRAVTEARAA